MIIFTDLRAILVRAKQFSQNFQFALFSTCTVCLLTDLAEKLFEIGQFWRRHMNTDSISLPIVTLKTQFGKKITLQGKKYYRTLFSGTPCIYYFQCIESTFKKIQFIFKTIVDLVNRKYTSEVNVVWLWYQLGKTSKIKTMKHMEIVITANQHMEMFLVSFYWKLS